MKMKIEDIQDPSFLKDMSPEECQKLADQIREFLIESVSKTGGHLASNLGVVELTIALHKSFDSPHDKIFFDVGHQCYTHKILTGRAKEFSTLRQYNGLSGFQRRSESEHDVWEGGHSSTSLSAALGMAIARDLRGEDYYIVPVIGDGALESGIAMEALNQIGDEQRKIIIVFNDNEMSISQNVGVLAKDFARLRVSPQYTGWKTGVKQELNKSELGTTILSGLRAIRDSVKDVVVDEGVFGEFGLDYLGPIDGHDIRELLYALDAAKEKVKSRPVVVHVLTTKGKGYGPCEADRVGYWHGVSPFDVVTGKSVKKKKEGMASWSEVMSDSVRKLAEKDERIVAITPAMVVGSKLEKFFREFPRRSFDTGIAEEHAATLAAGLAISGLRPYLCVYSTFLQRAYDEVSHDICRMDLPVVIGIDRAGIVGADGPTHHGVFDVGMLRGMPNMILAQPRSSAEAQRLLVTAFSQEHPFAIRYPRADTEYDPSSLAARPVEIGSWEVLGGYITDKKPVICTYGPNVDRVLEKAEEENVDCLVVNCRFFKPLDETVMRLLCESDNPVFVYETDMKAEGLGSAMLEWANAHQYAMKMTDIGIGDLYVPQGDEEHLYRDLGIDLDTLFSLVKKEA